MPAPTRCANDNHRRAIVRVRCCSGCGEILNATIPRHACKPTDHARMRRIMAPYCVDCGERLIATR